MLDRIEFEPALPAARSEPLAAVRYGEAAKLFVPLRAPAPPSAVMSVPERYWAWTATGAADEPQPVVSAFAGSPGALDRLGRRRRPADWLASLARLRPDLELDARGRAAVDLVRRPLGARRLLDLAAAPSSPSASRTPLGPLAFAGEHLGGEFAALMEGAIRSGGPRRAGCWPAASPASPRSAQAP